MGHVARPNAPNAFIQTRFDRVAVVAWFVFCAHCLVGLQGCSESTPAPKSTQLQTIPEEPQHGFLRRVFTDANGSTHNHLIFVPYVRAADTKLPVVLFLNGLGENGDDGLSQISNNFGTQLWESKDFFPFLFVAPQCRFGSGWSAGGDDAQWALQILDEAIRDFGGDEDRVYLTGVSNGAAGVWSIASAFPERFAAIVPVAANSGGDADRLAAARLPVWNFYNAGDKPELVAYNRRMRQRLIEGGASPRFTEYPDSGHDCWNRAFSTSALFRWLLEQRRSQNRKEAAFTPVLPQDVVKKWKKIGGGSWEVETGEGVEGVDVLVGSGSVTPTPLTGHRRDERWSLSPARGERGSVVPSPALTGALSRGAGEGETLLMSDEAGESFEFHADVWLPAGSDRRIGLFPEQITQRQFWVSVMPPDLGTGGLVDGDGNWLAELDPAAQATLRTEAWNDVRLKLAAGRLTFSINGWPALDIELERHGGKPSPVYRIALAAPENGSEVRWRFIRTREQVTGNRE